MAEILTRGDFSRCPDPTMGKTCSYHRRKKINSLLKGGLKANFLRFPDISYTDDYLQDLVHLGATSPVSRNTGIKKSREYNSTNYLQSQKLNVKMALINAPI